MNSYWDTVASEAENFESKSFEKDYPSSAAKKLACRIYGQKDSRFIARSY